MRTYSNFSAISTAKPFDANGNLQTNFVYTPGNAGDIVVVRLMYEWPIYVSLLGFNLADMTGNKRLIIATAALRNEPYLKGGCHALRLDPSCAHAPLRCGGSRATSAASRRSSSRCCCR